MQDNHIRNDPSDIENLVTEPEDEAPSSSIIRFDHNDDVACGTYPSRVHRVEVVTRKNGPPEQFVKIFFRIKDTGQIIANVWRWSTFPKSLLATVVRTLLGGDLPIEDFDLQSLTGIRCRIEVVANGHFKNVAVLERLPSKKRGSSDEEILRI